MTAPIRLVCVAVLCLAVAACTSKPVNEMPAAAAAPSDAKPEAAADAKPDAKTDAKPEVVERAKPMRDRGDVTPTDRAEANAQCWMKYDKSGGTLEAKAKLVEKCSDDKMKGR
jgi:hypothetical protein